ncbi:MAG: hypothetical protein RJA07_504 [Bacteroidota bacterium]|jgi:hypothetical protein
MQKRINLFQTIIFFSIIFLWVITHSVSTSKIIALSCFASIILLAIINLIIKDNYKKTIEYLRFFSVALFSASLSIKLFHWGILLPYFLFITLVVLILFWIYFYTKNKNDNNPFFFMLLLTFVTVSNTLRPDVISNLTPTKFKQFIASFYVHQIPMKSVYDRTFEYSTLLHQKNIEIIFTNKDSSCSVRAKKIKSKMISQLIDIENSFENISLDSSLYMNNIEWQQKLIIQNIDCQISKQDFDSLKILTNSLLKIKNNR